MLSSVSFPGLLTLFNLFSAFSMWTLANIIQQHQKPNKGRKRIETVVKNLLLCNPRIKSSKAYCIRRIKSGEARLREIFRARRIKATLRW